MDNFRKGGFGGNRDRGGFGKGGFGGRRNNFSGNRERGPVQMFQAVCAECQKKCEVPFKPSGDKPVYCNNCFSSKKDSQPRRDFQKRDRRSDFAPRRDFVPDQKMDNSGIDNLKKQIDMLNMKLDSVIEILGRNTQKADVGAEKTERKISKKKRK